MLVEWCQYVSIIFHDKSPPRRWGLVEVELVLFWDEVLSAVLGPVHMYNVWEPGYLWVSQLSLRLRGTILISVWLWAALRCVYL
jgi:hypothetical protein